MNKFSSLKTTGLAFLILAGLCAPAHAQKAPADLQVPLIIKLLGFYTNLGSDPFTIHVVGAPEVAKKLRTQIGVSVGKATLNEVTESDGAPTNGAKVIYIGKATKAGKAGKAGKTGKAGRAGNTDNAVTGIIEYSQKEKVLTITDEPLFVIQGVTLGLKFEGEKPTFLLNLSAAKAEGVNWNPAIYKVASPY